MKEKNTKKKKITKNKITKTQNQYPKKTNQSTIIKELAKKYRCQNRRNEESYI